MAKFQNKMHFFYTCRKTLSYNNFSFDETKLRHLCLLLYEKYNNVYITYSNIKYLNKHGITQPVDFLLKKINIIENNDEIKELLNYTDKIIEFYDSLIVNKEQISGKVDLLGVTIYNDIVNFAYSFSNKYMKTYGDYCDNALNDLKEVMTLSGVYRLYGIEKNLIYIGKSYTLGRRILNSSSDKDAVYYDFTIINNKVNTDIYEIFYIGKYKPKLNELNVNEDVCTLPIPLTEFCEIKALFDFKNNIQNKL